MEQLLANGCDMDALQFCDEMLALEPDCAAMYAQKGQIAGCHVLLRPGRPAKCPLPKHAACEYTEALALFETFTAAWKSACSHTVSKDLDPYFYHGKSRALLAIHGGSRG
jgi:hypothetical protein